MITVLHGENIVASRKELDRIKSEFSGEIISLEGKNISETDFIQATQSASLLAEKRLVVVENGPELTLKNVKGDVIFWYDKELGKKSLENFTQSRIQLFKIETIIFKFCDALLPGNGKKSVELFRDCLKTMEPEYIFIMIVRQFRLMLNPTMATPWQQSKMLSASKAFGQEKLKKVYNQLLQMDYQAKTGQYPAGLVSALELFLLKL